MTARFFFHKCVWPPKGPCVFAEAAERTFRDDEHTHPNFTQASATDKNIEKLCLVSSLLRVDGTYCSFILEIVGAVLEGLACRTDNCDSDSW